MKRIYLILLVVIISKFLNAQNAILFDNEISAYVGLSVTTMTSNGFYHSPESIVFKASMSNFTSLKKGYTIGLNLNSISTLKMMSMPLYFSYRSNPTRIPIPRTYGLTIPFNIVLSAGPNFGYISGNVNDDADLKLNRSFVSSLDVSLKLCYLFGAISLILNPELSFLITKNYSFNTNEGWENPLSFFKGAFGIGYSF